MNSVLIRRPCRETEEESHVTGRDWSDVAISQGMTKIASNYQKPERDEEGASFRGSTTLLTS